MSEWDYTGLAPFYLKRPPYSEHVIDQFFLTAGITRGMKACDVGAGTANLTLSLLNRGIQVVAVEPNEAMRRLGIVQARAQRNLTWCCACGEETGQPSAYFDLVTFGSSFNVVDRQEALRETARILKPGGWFACVWNHRDLADPLQGQIERIIRSEIPGYTYGVRRQDQADVIQESGLFQKIQRIEGAIVHRMTVADCMEAWQSHATLRRQAGNKFERILGLIKKLLEEQGNRHVDVPYITRLWMAASVA